MKQIILIGFFLVSFIDNCMQTNFKIPSYLESHRTVTRSQKSPNCKIVRTIIETRNCNQTGFKEIWHINIQGSQATVNCCSVMQNYEDNKELERAQNAYNMLEWMMQYYPKVERLSTIVGKSNNSLQQILISKKYKIKPCDEKESYIIFEKILNSSNKK